MTKTKTKTKTKTALKPPVTGPPKETKVPDFYVLKTVDAGMYLEKYGTPEGTVNVAPEVRLTATVVRAHCFKEKQDAEFMAVYLNGETATPVESSRFKQKDSFNRTWYIPTPRFKVIEIPGS